MFNLTESNFKFLKTKRNLCFNQVSIKSMWKGCGIRDSTLSALFCHVWHACAQERFDHDMDAGSTEGQTSFWERV